MTEGQILPKLGDGWADDLIDQMAEALWKETPIADDRSHPRYRRMARAALDALKAYPRCAYVELPVVAHKGPHDTDASMFRTAAERLDSNHHIGGSNLRRAVSQLLRDAAKASEGAQ